MPLLEAPEILSHVLTIPPPANAGQSMELRGRVLQSDGKTPASGVVVYFHHTDGRGIYSVRGWLRSNSEGMYVLRTTRPAPYPRGRTPAHIHAYGLPRGSNQGVVFPGIVFAGDPFLTASDEGIVALTEDENGVLQGSFDLVIPN
jgi:protocatechuate 3,4-dioxygenase beta subunit